MAHGVNVGLGNQSYFRPQSGASRGVVRGLAGSSARLRGTPTYVNSSHDLSFQAAALNCAPIKLPHMRTSYAKRGETCFTNKANLDFPRDETIDTLLDPTIRITPLLY